VEISPKARVIFVTPRAERRDLEHVAVQLLAIQIAWVPLDAGELFGTFGSWAIG
jgi:hypothetical protein